MSHRRIPGGAGDGPIGPALRRGLRSGVDAPDLVDPIMARVYARRGTPKRSGGSARGPAMLMALVICGAAAWSMVPKGLWSAAEESTSVASARPEAEVVPERFETSPVDPSMGMSVASAVPANTTITTNMAKEPARAVASVSQPMRDEGRIGEGTVASQMESALRETDSEWLAVR